jgi:hypothetical protein
MVVHWQQVLPFVFTVIYGASYYPHHADEDNKSNLKEVPYCCPRASVWQSKSGAHVGLLVELILPLASASWKLTVTASLGGFPP